MDLLLVACGGLLAGLVGALMGVGGGIVAVVLANIVAIFLMRMIGKNLEA